jgi:hypothetical protein
MIGGDEPALSTKGRLSIGELSVRSSCSPEEIQDFGRRGLFGGPGADGLFEPGDVSRLRLLTALLRSGIAWSG